LIVAALLKLRDLVRFETALVRLLPDGAWRVLPDSRRLVRVVVGVEIVLGVALLIVPSGGALAVGVVATVVFAGFSLMVFRAVRAGVGCGCAGGRGSRRATRADAFRSVVLAAAAVVFTVLAATGGAAPLSTHLAVPAVGVAVGVLVLAYLPSVVIVLAERLTLRNGGHVDIARERMPDEPANTRRAFLRLASASALGILVGGAALGASSASAQQCIDCFGAYRGCRNCCTKYKNESACRSCCKICYDDCTYGYLCAQKSCYGCWRV
jgi:hypothetical protein